MPKANIELPCRHSHTFEQRWGDVFHLSSGRIKADMPGFLSLAIEVKCGHLHLSGISSYLILSQYPVYDHSVLCFLVGWQVQVLISIFLVVGNVGVLVILISE